METEIGKDIQKAGQLLSSGQLVSIPTETVYGLGGNGFDKAAALKIFEVKNRPSFDPLILHVDSLTKAKAFVTQIPAVVLQLAEAFSPGPITFILPKKPAIPDIVTSGKPNVAVRIPNHPLTLELLQALTFPVAAPSANPFGYISPTSAQHVWDQLNGKIPYILDGGPCQVGMESTIVAPGEGGSNLQILRLGGLSLEAIQEVIPQTNIGVKASDQPSAPGQLKSHYAPGVPLQIGDFQGVIKTYEPSQIGTLVFTKPIEGIPKENQWVLSAKGDLKEAAANLFKAMRELDKGGFVRIVAETFPEKGLGRAINDRLQKAAVK